MTIHPFEDGNGRIARALSDMLLARSDKSTQRFYSMAAQIRLDRKQYYAILEKTQGEGLDVTAWLNWFLTCLINALSATNVLLGRILFKASFWQKHPTIKINARQKKLLNRVLDGFEGKLTSSKWAKIAKCSKDTAIRDINDLVNKGILQQEAAGGRSTNYKLKHANIQYPTANTQQPISNSQHPTANIQQPTPNSQYPTANTQQPTPNSQYPIANNQHPTTNLTRPRWQMVQQVPGHVYPYM